jgi:hypothetical protein
MRAICVSLSTFDQRLSLPSGDSEKSRSRALGDKHSKTSGDHSTNRTEYRARFGSDPRVGTLLWWKEDLFAIED